MRSKLKILSAILLVTAVAAFLFYYTVKPLPGDIENKGSQDVTAWISLATAVISLAGSIISFSAVIVQRKQQEPVNKGKGEDENDTPEI